MALLNFKLGNFAGLANATKSTGTVYITKDEKAMYVDVDDSTRIRIGDIIQLESTRVAKPPFSTEAFYYFIEENALLKWNGTEWKQLNSVSDLQANISSLQSDVAKLKTTTEEHTSSIADLQKADSDLQAQITANKEAIESNDSDISGLDSRLTAAEAITAKVAGIESTVGNHTTRLESAEKTISEHTTAINANTTAIGDTATEGSLVYRVGAVETSVTGIKNDIGADATAGTVKGRISALETNVGGLTTTVEDHEDAISALQTAVGADAEGLSGKLSALTARVDTAENDIDALEDRATAIEGVNTEQNTKIASLETTVGKHTGAIEKLNADSTTEGSVDYKVAALKTSLESADSALGGRIDSVSAVANQNKTDIATLNANLATANTNIGNNTTAIENLKSDVDTKISASEITLKTEIAKSINAANAMNYIGDITSLAGLPTSNVHVGDTYVVTEKFTDNSVTYNAGDMLIAKGDEDETSGVITSNLGWDHVKTGYDASNEAKLSGDNDAIALTSHVGGNLGKITFADGGSGIKATVSGNVVTLSIEWGTF